MHVHTPVSRNIINLFVDATIFVAFLVATAPRLSGLAIHEWLGIAFGAAIVTHLLLHWSWIVQVTRRFFGKVTWSARLNYVLNSLLFVAMTVVIVTGLLISEEALPLFGIRLARDSLWLWLHRQATDLTVLIIGLHLALHWRWIVNTTRRLFARRAPWAAIPAAQIASIVRQKFARSRGPTTKDEGRRPDSARPSSFVLRPSSRTRHGLPAGTTSIPQEAKR